jgi:hypothetical protein
MDRKPPSLLHPLRRLLSFPVLRGDRPGAAGPLSEGELLFELAGENPENLLFGRYGAAEIRARLAAAGIMAKLSARGYADPAIVLECGDPAEQRVTLLAGETTRNRLLMEARLQVASFRPGRPIGSLSGTLAFRMLVIHWLEICDPDRSFTVDRPRLPGQRRPGLGLLRESLAFLRGLSGELGLDGVLDVPEHYHTALFYSRMFRFLDPAVEGRFRAIVRELRGVPLALTSEAIEEGCLVDRDTRETVPWAASEQVMPLRGELRRFLGSAEYAAARAAAHLAFRPAVDWDRYRLRIAEKKAPPITA